MQSDPFATSKEAIFLLSNAEEGDYILIDRYISIYQNGLTNPSPLKGLRGL
jgi:hypothetical protein